ncbi:GNAT family protein [Pseudomonas sp. F1_0610]|uniref:GNAT family N-acetyltransferase n=1 Tax=Pseudomonas sp. F1_0610 TaxID=3114284 RepID=UPI0039C366DD
MWIEEKKLEGLFVTLIPLAFEHLSALQEIANDDEAEQLWFATLPKKEQMSSYIAKALDEAQKGNIAYVVFCNESQRIVGTTRYYAVDEHNRRAMIGYTWYHSSVRRTPVNTEAKFLLLHNLFENHAAIAAEFRTHTHNFASRSAIERLGAKLDGILRNHMILRDGSYRDTAVYSIINTEWAAIKPNLLFKLNQYSAPYEEQYSV